MAFDTVRKTKPPSVRGTRIDGFATANWDETTVSERVIVVLAGVGKLVIDGESVRFRAPCTLVIPKGSICSIVNQGAESLRAVVVTSACIALLPGEPAEPIQ